MRAAIRNKTVLWLAYFLVIVVASIALPDPTLVPLGTFVLVVMILPVNYFPIFYTLAFRWWRKPLGRALFIKAAGLALVLNAALFFTFFGEATWAEEIRFVAYTVVLTGMTYQSLVMTRIRLEASNRKKVESDNLEGVEMRKSLF